MNKLNIVNGMAMYNHLKEKGIELGGEVIPFNDAMCDGEASEDIFGGEFSSLRAHVHGVGSEEYDEIVINPLAPLFELDADEIDLYFDEDMFCQINLITILAYLDKNEYEGQVFLNVIDNHYHTIKRIEIKPEGFYALYLDVVLAKRPAREVLPEVLDRGVKLYLQYSSNNNEIIDYIKTHSDMEESELLEELFFRFSYYGLGDVQYRKLVDFVRN